MCKIFAKLVSLYVSYKEMQIKNQLGSVGGENVLVKYPYTISHPELIHIDKNTQILKGSRIQIYPELTGINAKVLIGKNCFIGYSFTILAGESIMIGDNVLIASHVSIFSENHGMEVESELSYAEQPLQCKQTHIDEGCWIGENVVILPGVKIGKKCVIGAGSIVTHDIPDYCKVAGNPAKIISKYNFEKHRWEKECHISVK